MFHGRKKQEKKELTEEEKKAINDKLEKITNINKTLLKKRADKEYDESSLQQTEKFSFLSPDFPTLWNYRREILLHLMEKMTVQEKYAMVGKELELLLKGIMRSLKSYTLWHHRQWTIEQGLNFEREMNEAAGKKGVWQSKILETELAIGNKLLSKDERNFHCWNYRLQVVQTYIEEIEKRLGNSEGEESNDDKVYETQCALVNKECEMASALIQKNFSNYSAWHFRGKLLPHIFAKQADRLYLIPYEKMKEDFALLQHALFTDPKDQSPWNYHEWMFSLMTPVQVVALSVEEHNDHTMVVLGLSHKVKNFDKLNINLLNETGDKIQVDVIAHPVRCRGRDISSCWVLSMPTEQYKEYSQTVLNLSIRQDKENTGFEAVNGMTIFRSFFNHLNTKENKFENVSQEVWPQESQLMTNLAEILKQEIDNLKQLTEFEEDLRYALLRLQELTRIQYEYLSNPYYSDVQFEFETLQAMEDRVFSLSDKLIEADPTHKLYYTKMQKSANNVFVRWNELRETGVLSPRLIELTSAVRKEISDNHTGFFLA